jgi:sugar lactone lactonase YvrE
LKFTTLLTPSALVYDAVSRRFIVADRRARRIAVIDATTGQVSTLVGAQGDLGEIGGITIDPQQGDLWAVSSADNGSQELHRIQLISGRVLKSVPLSGVTGRVVAMAFVPGTGLLVADDSGRIMRVRPGGGSAPLAELEYVPRALAADARGRLYVTAGGPRLARFAVGAALRRTGLVDLAPGTPFDAPFTVAEGRLHFVVVVDGAYEIRSSPLR